jgi:chromate transporter
MTPGILWALAIVFAPLSLLMFGGANAIIPEIHRQVVEARGWLGDDEFATLFAVAQVAPGPNILIVSLIGWRLAGPAGLLVATAAINLPHCLLTYGIGRAVARFERSFWLYTVKQALVPVTTGLILASGVVMGRAADHGPLAVTITLATAAFIVFSNRNPLWVLGAGAIASVVASRVGMAG